MIDSNKPDRSAIYTKLQTNIFDSLTNYHLFKHFISIYIFSCRSSLDIELGFSSSRPSQIQHCHQARKFNCWLITDDRLLLWSELISPLTPNLVPNLIISLDEMSQISKHRNKIIVCDGSPTLITTISLIVTVEPT